MKAAGVILASLALHAADAPKFETASVKRMPCGIINNSLGPGTVVLRGDPLSVILVEAFKVKAYQIVGPSWLDTDCFEIVAKMPEGATGDQVPAMLQTLVVERFQMAARKEERPGPVYALVVDKGGPKFQAASANFNRMGQRPGLVMFRAGPTQGFKGIMTMAKVAGYLSGNLDRPVRDLTGLEGTYDIDVSWAFDPAIDRPGANTLAGRQDRLELPPPPAATLFAAIRETLGLRLDARKEPVEMLVIDHVERTPVEN
jgi:uncharacterized protein (TIGR03435 family)